MDRQKKALEEFSGDLTGVAPVKPKNEFEGYWLEGQPFPPKAIPPHRVDYCFDQIEARKAFERIVRQTVSGDGSVVTLLAQLRDGKSHLLRYFENRVRERLYPDNVGIAVYVDKEWQGDTLKLFTLIQRGIGVEKWLKIVGRIATEKLLLDSDQIATFISEVTASEVESDLAFADALVPDVFDYIYGVSKERDFSLALANLLHPRNRRLAWKYLTGLRIYKAEANELGLDTVAIDASNLFFFFSAKFKTLAHLFDGVFLFIDELESLTRGRAESMLRTRTDLRRLIDTLPANCSMIFSCDSRTITSLYAEDPALIGRFGEMIRASPITSYKDGVVYLEGYLDKARSPDFKKTNKIHPFNQEVVEHLTKSISLKEGRCPIGFFLKICRLTLMEGIKAGVKGELTTDLVDAALEMAETEEEEI